MAERPCSAPLDPHDHALVRVGAGCVRVSLAPVPGGHLALLRGEQAVLVVEAGKPVAVITRADLLEFVAHRGQG